MTIFQELGTDFTQWRKRYFDHVRSVAVFAESFGQNYKSYIGAPDFSQSDIEADGQRIPYVKISKAVEKLDGSGYIPEPIGGSYDYITRNSDGLWCAYLTTRLEEAKNTWPKQEFGVLLKFQIDGNQVDLTVARGEERAFRLQADDTSTFAPAFDFIAYLLKSYLRLGPNEQFKQRQTFGFITAPPAAPNS